MSAVAEREEAMQMLLAEVAPYAWYDVSPIDGAGPGWTVVSWRAGDPTTPVVRRAARLSLLRIAGSDARTACDLHTKIEAVGPCATVTVAEALLGHTCGRP